MSIANCKECGKAFKYKPSNKAGKYCSFECYKKHTNGPENSNWKNAGLKNCRRCGKEYKSYDPRRKYCSVKCALIRLCVYGKVTLICENCKKEYITCKGRGQKKRFCSKKCQIEFNVQTGNVTKICQSCNKPFIVWKSMQKQIFCSSKCLGESMKEKMKGAGNPRWIGGKTAYRGEDWYEQRRKAYERDNYTCQMCGEQLPMRLAVHHIIPYRISKDNRLNNLICMCIKCHPVEENCYRTTGKPSLKLRNILKEKEMEV